MPGLKQNVYFFRNYHGFTGGHLKVHHYFQHVEVADCYNPHIFFTAESMMNEENPWYPFQHKILKEWHPMSADLLFLGGMDWLGIPEKYRSLCPVPVINLIQGRRHSNPGTLLHSFLSHRAVRICVSKEVQEAIESTGIVNGPVFTIENGLDIDMIEKMSVPTENRKYEICIAGAKNPTLALALQKYIMKKGCPCTCLTRFMPRHEFLEILGQSRIAVLLPKEQEGYFLPFWEAAITGCIPICPKHDGATTTFQHGVNGFFPNYAVEDIFQSLQQCQQLDEVSRYQISIEAKALARKRSLESERKQFYKILEDVNQIYTA
jgi:hypothetical protein